MENQSKLIEFTLIFNKYKTRVYNYAYRMLSNQMIAEDIVQDVFIKLFDNLDKIRKKESIEFWLIKTVRNEIFSYHRNQAEKKLFKEAIEIDEIENSVLASSPAESFEINELKEIILNELNQMQDIFKEVFILREYALMSYKEIANILEIDQELVKSRLYKARQKLIDKISEKIS
ncbi:MAG: RNA polymerase sigma factor [Ignavibacterium album]|uniref:RNA polymerase sigma factor n=1 Tax=Ignavibacterium album TaxID=591197 RepID=UPI0026ED6F12|nr:RNA polymerase sigma factor [Ignavibacterium album]MBI5662754.1 RNA polymerase sigma factor [Ignavibacterium album]